MFSSIAILGHPVIHCKSLQDWYKTAAQHQQLLLELLKPTREPHAA